MTSSNDGAFAHTSRPLSPPDQRHATYNALLTASESASVLHSWTIQDGDLRERWLKGETPQHIADALGRSIAAIMTRAARLGLPRRSAPGRKPGQRNKIAPPNPPATRHHSAPAEDDPLALEMENASGGLSMRLCLMCLGRFQSAGRHNRICPKCKESPDYAAGCRITDVNFPV